MMEIASRSQLRMSLLRYALVTVPLILLLGTVSGRLAGSGDGNPWFDALEKPVMMPPGWVFGLAWPVLYVCLGVALALVLHARGAAGRRPALLFFAAQLALNFAWSPLFFAMHQVRLALLVIVVMLVLAAITSYLFGRIRKAAGLLLLPYLGWLCFAALLNYQIIALNPDAETLVPTGSSAEIAI